MMMPKIIWRLQHDDADSTTKTNNEEKTFFEHFPPLRDEPYEPISCPIVSRPARRRTNNTYKVALTFGKTERVFTQFTDRISIGKTKTLPF